MTENKTKTDLYRLETVEQNLRIAFNTWTEEVNVSKLPKAMQRKHAVVSNKLAALMSDIYQYLSTERRVGRPAGGITKTYIRNKIKNATPEQLAAIAKFLGQHPETETEISTFSAHVETIEEVNKNE